MLQSCAWSVYDDSSCYVYVYHCGQADKLCCVQALTLDSRSVEALSLKGLALMEVKKTPEALSHFREALRLAPHRFEAYNSKCLSHWCVWATVCKTVRPMLSDHCPVLSCPVCLQRWCIVAKRLDGSR